LVGDLLSGPPNDPSEAFVYFGMNAKAGIFLRLLPLCLGLIPAVAAAQGSIGPLQRYSSGGGALTTWARAGSVAYFTTSIPSYPPQPFLQEFKRTDGTLAGTFSIDPRGSASPANQPGIDFVNSLDGLLFFTSAPTGAPEDRRLWRTDGTRAGTVFVTPALSLGLESGVQEFPFTLAVPERHLMFFSANSRSGIPDFELWATDGTFEGTRLVKDVNPEGSSNPRRMIDLGGRLFFFADTPQGRELWRSDGTPEGTERVHAFPQGDPENLDLVQAGGALFVLADTEAGVEVWRSDGTEAGTVRVLNLPQRLRRHQATGRHLFLVVGNADQNEMWAVAGGTGEAVRLPQAGTARGIELFAAGDHLVFSLEDDHGWEPWWSDGTPAGTHRIDVCPGACSSVTSFASFAGTYRGRAVLRLDDGVSGTETWLTDGTAAGTWRLGDLCPGPCSAFPEVQEINGWLALRLGGDFWISDGSPDSAWSVGTVDNLISWIPLPDRLLFASSQVQTGILSSLPMTAPAPPLGPWLESARLPGFRFKVRIDDRALGRQEPACMERTLCVSGAVPGRSEVFLRISGTRPNGRLWPALIKLTTSVADVWVLQKATGHLRHYRLQGSGAAGPTLPGLLDRDGFPPAAEGLELAAGEAKAAGDLPPPGPWIDSTEVPGFRIQARLTSGGTSRVLRKEACIAETFCLSGALPGVTELLVRVPGPKPNGYFWPTLGRFTPAALEVWVQQKKTGKIRYYRLNAPPAGQLDGSFDRQGFKR
jgi:ELWxxDGT repeat protein